MIATDFNRLVTLQERTPSGDAYTWSTFKRAWAKRLTGPGSEFMAGEQVLAQTDARYVMPWTSGVDPTMRLVDGDDIYNITNVATDDETGRDYLWLRVQSGTNEG